MTLTKTKSHMVGFQGLAPTMVYAVENAFQVGTQRPIHSSCLPLGRDGGQASLLANCSEDKRTFLPKSPMTTLTVPAESPAK